MATEPPGGEGGTIWSTQESLIFPKAEHISLHWLERVCRGFWMSLMVKDVWCNTSLFNEDSSFTKVTVFAETVCTEGWVRMSSLSTTESAVRQTPSTEPWGQRDGQGSHNVSALQTTTNEYRCSVSGKVSSHGSWARELTPQYLACFWV